MNSTTGRCAILFPHGVLSRNDELSMRKVLVQLDLVEAVIGIGKSLFYNSPMEACIIICRSKKTSQRRKKILFINAKNEVTRKNAQSYLEPEHIRRIAKVYKNYSVEEGFSNIADIEEIAANNYSLGIPKYVSGVSEESEEEINIEESVDNWSRSSNSVSNEFNILNDLLQEGGEENA